MNDPLSNQLRQEGLASSPEYSAQLHERAMRALRQNRLRDAVRIMPLEPWRLVLAAAAAVLISATAWWAYDTNPTIIPVAKSTVPAPITLAIRTPAPDQLLRTADPIANALSGAVPLENIAQDAKWMASYFVRQLPTIPAPQNNRQL